MRALLERAEALAKAAQRRHLDEIAEAWSERGLAAVTDESSVIIEARGLGRRRLTDLRFVGIVQ